MAGLAATDRLGTILFSGAAIAFLLGLQFGGAQCRWHSATVICLFVFAVVTLVAFFLVEARVVSDPLAPPRLFRNCSTLACLTIVFVYGAIYVSLVSYLPVYFQIVLGAHPVQGGVWKLAGTLPLSLGTIGCGLWIHHTGRYRSVIWLASILLTIGVGLFVDFGPHRRWAKIITYQITTCLGTAALFQSPLLSVQAAVLPEDTAAANAVVFFVRSLGSAVGLVAGQAVLQNADLSLPDKTESIVGGNGFGHIFELQNLDEAERLILVSKFCKALRSMWTMYTALSTLIIVAGWFIHEYKLSDERANIKTGTLLVTGKDQQWGDERGSILPRVLTTRSRAIAR